MRLIIHPNAPISESVIFLLAEDAQGMMRQMMLQPSLPFEQVLGEGWDKKRVIVDFKDITYIDSAAIGWLICAHNAFEQNGGRLVLCNLQVSVHRVLTVMRLDEVLLIADDMDYGQSLVSA